MDNLEVGEAVEDFAHIQESVVLGAAVSVLVTVRRCPVEVVVLVAVVVETAFVAP